MTENHFRKHLSKPIISILVPTLNRDHKVIACITSILSSKKNGVEIFLLDQNQTPSLFLKQFVLNYPCIHYIQTNTKNKAVALNKALTLVRGDIVAFTDDDCVVSKQWINEILSSFSIQKNVAIITGNTYPYKNISKRLCPPTIATKTTLFMTPTHHKHIGYGNNFAARKNLFTTIGVFQTWLGPGSISTNCEDGELFIRALMNRFKILHNQNMIVYHNKQLSRAALEKQQHSYVLGETACYMFYALRGWGFAKRIIRQNVIDTYNEWKFAIKNCVHKNPTKNLWFITSLLYARCKGVLIGTWQHQQKA